MSTRFYEENFGNVTIGLAF